MEEGSFFRLPIIIQYVDFCAFHICFAPSHISHVVGGKEGKWENGGETVENVGPAPKTKKNLFKWLEGKGRRVDVEIVIVKGWKMEDGKYGVGLTHFPPEQ